MHMNNRLPNRLLLIVACILVIAMALLLQPAAIFAAGNTGNESKSDIEMTNSAGGANTDIEVDPVGKTEGYSAVLYDNTSGLPTSEANAIAETSEGFIWIGSYSGLIRYDGNTFERIDSTTGIASVVCLYVDSRDRLWVGTNDNGVALMEKGEFRMLGKSDGLGSDAVRGIVEDDQGRLYVATTSGIVLIDDDMNITPVDDNRVNMAYMRSIRLGNDGYLYCLTQGGDLFTIKDAKVSSYISSDKTGIDGLMAILPDPEKPGCVYLGTEGSNIYYGKLGKKFKQKDIKDVSPLNYIETFEYIDGQIWVCAGNGIGIIEGNKFTRLENVPMTSSVGHMMTDYEGNLWFTSTRQGVMKIVPNRFADVFERYDISSDVVNSTCMLDGNLFVATDTGLKVIGDKGLIDSIPLDKAASASGENLGATDLISLLNGCRIRSIIRDSKDRLWIATWQKYGLLRYDHGVLTGFNVVDGLFSERIRVVSERSDGTILVANTGGVNVIDGDKVTESYGEKDGITNTEILTVVEAPNGDIVMGSDGGGIYVLNDSGINNINKEDGLGSEVVMRIKHDPFKNYFWIITSNSISYMTEDYNVTTVSNFPYSNNFDLYESKNGDLWVLSSNGIYVTPVKDMMANEDINPVFYGMENGLPGISTANSYSDISDDGDLYLACTTGVVKVNIDETYEKVDDLKVSVPFIGADGKMVYPNSKGIFTIPSTVRKVTVYSYVYNYSLINPKVSYHLDGLETSDMTVNRNELVPVDYTNLRGGTYDFVIQLSDSFGDESKSFSVRIIKEKAFYEMPWFYGVTAVFLICLITSVVMLFMRRKMKALEKKQQENMTFTKEITEAFAKVIDMKDAYTNGHSSRVANYTAMLARELGYDEETVEKYYRIALLHDIGKIGVPGEVLNKPGKLTDEEYAIIKSHAAQGYEVLKDISIMPELATGAGSHHERPDGRGYPNGLKGDEIPRVAQIIAVADTFDAMYSNRPYRNRMNYEKALSIIKEVSGTQLTSDVVDAFLRLAERGDFRAPDDKGGGTTEDIQNIK